MSEGPTPPRPKAKKLPFKPTALHKSASQRSVTPSADGKEDDGLDLFRRAKEMEPIVAADRERRMKKKKQKEEERRKSIEPANRPLDDDEDIEVEVGAEANRSPRGDGRGTPVGRYGEDEDILASELVTPPASKRIRFDSSSAKRTNLGIEDIDPSLGDSPSTRLLRSRRTPATPNVEPVILILSDDDDGEQLAPSPSKRRDDEADVLKTFMATDDDDEFAKYVHRAEEQRARDQAMLSTGPNGETTKAPVEILVTSVVPGAKPCCFKFLFNKQLRIARNTWLTLQHHKGILKDVEKGDDIVLTWCKKKVYSFSTLMTLGIRPRGNGTAVVDGHGVKDLPDGRTRVYMEAWTVDLFQQMEREEELKRRRDAGELSDEDSTAEEEPAAPVVKLRVILKARDVEEVDLTVRPETTVETLITVFRTQRSIGSDKEVGLWFDGDRLEEHVTMDEAEIDDLDTIEVHMR